jgi:hypothetical protein
VYDTKLPNLDLAAGEKRPTLLVVAATRELMRFEPGSFAFTEIGLLDLPFMTFANALAVARSGAAYLSTSNGRIFRLDTATAACAPTPFSAETHQFRHFEMAFAGDETETLYLSQRGYTNRVLSRGLARVDLASLRLHFIGEFSLPVGPVALSGGGAGRLFGFALNVSGTGSSIFEIDPRTAKLLAQNDLDFGKIEDCAAFVFWGGDFLLFLATASRGRWPVSEVVRYRPSDGSLVTMGMAPIEIVGVAAYSPPG